MAIIRIHYAGGRAEDRAVPYGTYRIGRDAGEIVLSDPNTSGRHAELYVQPGHVGIADVGSTNGTFDRAGQRVTGYHPMGPGEWVRMGNCGITLLAMETPEVAPPAAQPPSPPPAAALIAPSAYAADRGIASRGGPYGDGAGAYGSSYNHPDQPVRHAYPVNQTAFGIGGALQLLMKTAPFLVARLATLIALSTVGLIYWVVAVAGFVFLAHKTVVVAWAWLVCAAVVAGWFWRVIVRYFLYLLKMGHIAVLTELVTKGQVGNGSEGMFAYGKRIVQQHFGEIAALFAVHILIDGVVGAFNRSLDWVSSLIPIPGLQSVVGFVQAVLKASTRYIAETIFSYNLARGDTNVFRSSKDALIYYAQNSREILMTGLWVVLLEKVLSFIVFAIVFVPALVFAYMLPSAWGPWLPITALVAGILYAGNVRDAILRPLFLTMIMLKFHAAVRGQPINPEWDQRLATLSDKFRELSQKAAQWVAPAASSSAPAGAPQTAASR